MDNIIAIRYVGDSSLNESQKLTVLRYFNRVLAGQKDAIIASNAIARVTVEKGNVTHVEVVGTDVELSKLISTKISDARLPF